MNIAKIVFFILISFTCVQGQSFFKGGVLLGTNFSQIDGDDLAGYHKYGLTAGLKVEFPLNSVLDFGLEFLYSQRGSRTSIYNNLFEETYKIQLDYISLPLVLKWSDWWVEDEAYYKFNIHGGVSNGYLISSNVVNALVNIDEPFNSYDLSLFLGGGFFFTKNWGVTLRYTKSINAVYNLPARPGQIGDRLVGYFLTLRTEYNF